MRTCPLSRPKPAIPSAEPTNPRPSTITITHTHTHSHTHTYTHTVAFRSCSQLIQCRQPLNALYRGRGVCASWTSVCLRSWPLRATNSSLLPTPHYLLRGNKQLALSLSLSLSECWRDGVWARRGVMWPGVRARRMPQFR